jgi:hypothetical protein
VSQEEVAFAVDALKRIRRRDFASPRRKAALLAVQHAYGGLHSRPYWGVLKVTPVQIRDAVRETLKPSRFTVLIQGQAKELHRELEYAGFKEKGLPIFDAEAFSPQQD